MMHNESKVLEAAREWALSLERQPDTLAEKRLLVAVYEAYRHDFNHDCGCDRRCEDCPTQDQVESSIRQLKETIRQEEAAIKDFIKTMGGR